MPVKIKEVYVVTDRGDQHKSWWSRIGVAFVNKDNSLNVILDAIPLTGRIQIRDRVEPLLRESAPKEVHRDTLV